MTPTPDRFKPSLAVVSFGPAPFNRARVWRGGFLPLLGLLAGTAFAQTTITYTNGQNDSTNYDSTSSGQLTLTIASGAATQSGVLSGSQDYFKTGAGTLTLSGANTNTANMAISAGTLALAGAGTLGAGNGAVYVNNNATLDLGGTTQNVAFVGLPTNPAAGFVAVVGNIANGTIHSTYDIFLQSGTITATFTGSGTLYIGGDPNATVTLNGRNDLTSLDPNVVIGSPDLGLAGGTVKVGNANALASASGYVHIYTATLDLNGIANVRGGAIVLQSGSDSTLINGNTGSAASFAGLVALNGAGSQIGGAGNLTLSGQIYDNDGPGTLTKIGAGTLTLSGDNVFTGDTIISAGTLRLASSLALQYSTVQVPATGVLSFGSLTAATVGGLSGSNGLTLENDSHAALTLSVGNDFDISSTYAGALSGSGSLTKTGASEFTLSGTNTYTGGTNLSAGALILGSSGALPGSGAISFSGGVLEYSAANTTDYSSRFTFANNQSYGIDTGGQNVTFASALTGTGLFKRGSGTLTLTGANSYSVGVSVFGGTLALSGSGTFDGSIPFITIDGGTLDLGGKSLNTASVRLFNGSLANGTVTATSDYTFTNGNATVSANLAGDVPLDKSTAGTTLTLTGANTYTGGTTIHDGTLQVGNGGTSGSIAGDVANDGNLAFNRSNAVSFSGVISGAGTLTKLGAGPLTLSGANTYSGATTVSAGTLSVNGSLSASPVTVNSGGALGGSGTLGAVATIASGGHLAPGNSPGTLTFTQGLTLNVGSILDFQLGATSDLIRVSGGTLTGAGSLGGITLNLSDAGGFGAGTYTLFDFTSASTSSFNLSDFALGATISGFDYGLAFNGSTLELRATPSAVPEPSTYAAIVGGFALGAAVGWRRKTAYALQRSGQRGGTGPGDGLIGRQRTEDR